VSRAFDIPGQFSAPLGTPYNQDTDKISASMSSYFSSLRNLFRENPYKYLLSFAWRYAEGMRGKYVLIYLMFTGVNILVSIPPIIYGLYINFLQKGEGDPMQGTLIYVAIYLAITLSFWTLQWPARLLERRMAFAAIDGELRQNHPPALSLAS
jgi:hypothetical protein